MGQDESIKKKVEDLAHQSLDLLYDYLRLPSVSAQHLKIPETVAYVKKIVNEYGGETRVLDDLGGHPVIYAFFSAGKNGDASKTLLFYNHYDVQPPDPLDEWESDPFEPRLENGILYARGTADNKGSLMQRLVAIKYLRENGGLPCNVKFLIEGEEESGSRHLEPYLQKYKDLFRADACIWEFGSKDDQERVQLYAGVKGSSYFELSVKTADIDIHSSLAACIDNPAWRLVQALATMKSQQNTILVDDFFDEIQEPDEETKEAVRALPLDKASLSKLYGLKRPLITDVRGEDPMEALMFHPTMTICGMISGYTGEGTKTVLPKEAKVKLDCRTVPGQTGEHLYKCIKRHLERYGFSDVKVELIDAQKAYRSDIKHPFVQLVKKTAAEAYQSEVLLYPNSEGTGPMYIFNQYLGLPIVSTGVGWAQSKAHAPNESIRIQDYIDGVLHMVYLLQAFPEIK
ncbi:M20/M25/M40 family metallo-hydrolase [Weizmannia acidilactici]|uniref:M20/M25/M40 family metallo-hydrolase n=1 Tax=Weizmannia acidilactici TaxID=2607726 RepID=UPI00124C1057|nr:M20/M25/M40 family metallo-hydrolase [Weizmannia acidilactici]GER75087.1 acetylornithine deacetylase [Weizmannia acidilactici]